MRLERTITPNGYVTRMRCERCKWSKTVDAQAPVWNLWVQMAEHTKEKHGE